LVGTTFQASLRSSNVPQQSEQLKYVLIGVNVTICTFYWAHIRLSLLPKPCSSCHCLRLHTFDAASRPDGDTYPHIRWRHARRHVLGDLSVRAAYDCAGGQENGAPSTWFLLPRRPHALASPLLFIQSLQTVTQSLVSLDQQMKVRAMIVLSDVFETCIFHSHGKTAFECFCHN
jgi:hypothetical protein